MVKVEYDPAIVSYEDLLSVFWNSHNPSIPNCQDLDVGTQYRSVIFHTPEQKAAAIASKEQLRQSNRYKNPIVTEIKLAFQFYKAEDYHQQYLEKHNRRL